MLASKGAITDTNPDGVDRCCIVNALEMKAGMVGVCFPLLMSLLCLLLDAFRQEENDFQKQSVVWEIICSGRKNPGELFFLL